jgi:hypothetical protein
LTQPVSQCLAGRFANVDDEIVVYPVVVRFFLLRAMKYTPGRFFPSSSVRSDQGRQSQNPTSPTIIWPSPKKRLFNIIGTAKEDYFSAQMFALAFFRRSRKAENDPKET